MLQLCRRINAETFLEWNFYYVRYLVTFQYFFTKKNASYVIRVIRCTLSRGRFVSLFYAVLTANPTVYSFRLQRHASGFRSKTASFWNFAAILDSHFLLSVQFFLLFLADSSRTLHFTTMGDCTGKVVLVTGASSGIGAAVCRAFAKQGMVVIGAARREDRLKVT